MRWFRRQKSHSAANESDDWELQRARYLSKGRDISTEFSHIRGRKLFRALPVWLSVRGTRGFNESP